MRLLLVALVATVAHSSAAAAQARNTHNPCVMPGVRVPPRLEPVDEASRRADFLEFRRHLQDAVARNDETAILAVVDPGIRISLGDSGGAQAFKKDVIDNRDERATEFSPREAQPRDRRESHDARESAPPPPLRRATPRRQS